MARAAIRQASARVDVILPNELFALGGLIRRRLPVHVVNFRARPDEILRLAVTFQAPLHVKRLCPICDWHLIHLAMTGRATNSFRDVNTVIEIGEVRQIVHAVPSQRRILVEARAHRSEHGRFRPDLRVTRHAGVGGWNSGEGRLLD